MAQVVRVSRVIHACSERHSSTLSSPFDPSFSSPPSSSISCSPSYTSSTTLRVVVTLRTPPKRRWTLLTTPTSTHNSSCAKHYQKYICHCLLYWSQGIVYCTCGHFLVERESRRKSSKLRLNALSIPHYVIKKGRSHGVRHGKAEEQTEYHIAWNACKRCCKKVDSQGGILQVFTIDFSEIQFIVNHNSQSDGQNKSAKRLTNLEKKTI